MIVNDRDVLLQGSGPRATSAGTGLVLSGSSPTIRTAADGSAPSPAGVTLNLVMLGVSGTPAWSVSGGTLVGTDNLTRTLAASSMTGDIATITVSLTFAGIAYAAKYSITKVRDGSSGAGTPGDRGPAGTSYATALLYQWSTVQPALPNASSTLSWAAGVNTAYAGTDGWAIAAPTNPGVPGIKLWIVSKPISAPGGTESSTVSYGAGASMAAFTQNGAKGDTGAPGVKSAAVRAYQWSNGPAPTTAGTATYTWATATYDNVPAGWTKSKANPPGPGWTLYEATVNIVEASGAASSLVDWTTAAIVGISYMGVSGNGSTGASAAIAYTLIDGFTLAGSPPYKVEIGKALPATGTWGETRAWTAQPSVPAVGQAVFQSNGIYDPTSDRTTWGLPYLSNLRVGNLSALAVRTGSLIIDSIASQNGNFTVDVNGSVRARAISIEDAAGNVILGTSRPLADAYVPTSAQNSQLTPIIQAAATTADWSKVSSRPSDESIKNNLIDLSWWQRLGSSPWGSNGEYNVLANSLSDYGLPGPKGSDEVVWVSVEQGSNQGQLGDNAQGGGWNAQGFYLDKTKTYRFVVPIRHVSGSASSYWGTHGVASLNTTTLSPDDNPYFASVVLPNDGWYLFVGYIYPAGSTGNSHASSGVWSCKTGQKFAAGNNFCFMPDGRAVDHRAYQYYAGNIGATQMFGRPMINVVDGTEPALREYFDTAAVLNSMQQWGDVGGTGKPQDNATYGATLGANVSGSINDSNAASLVTVTSLRVVSPKIGNYSTPGAGGRTDLNDSGMRIYDGNGAMRVRIGNLAN